MTKRKYTKEEKAARRAQHDINRFSFQIIRDEEGNCVGRYKNYTSTMGNQAPAWEIINNPTKANKIFSVPDAEGNMVNLSLEWIAGFMDGEGTLTFHINRSKETRLGFQVQPAFIIAQGEQDYLLLTAIANFFGFGTVNQNRADKTSVRYNIRIVDPAVLTKTVIPLFKLVNLRTKKKAEFAIWAPLVEMINKGEHKTDWPNNYLKFVNGMKSLKYVGAPTDQALDFLSTCCDLEDSARNLKDPPK